MDLFIHLHFAYIIFYAYCKLQDGYNRAGLVEL